MNTEKDLRSIQYAIGEATILLVDDRQILSKNAVMAKLQRLSEMECDARRVLTYWNARKRLGYIRPSATGFTLPDYASRVSRSNR